MIFLKRTAINAADSNAADSRAADSRAADSRAADSRAADSRAADSWAADSWIDAEREGNLAEALGNFRSSVHSWNDAEAARARTIAFAEHRRTWRSAMAWALGCVLAAGSLSAGMYEHLHGERLARIAAERQAAEHYAQQEQAAEQARLRDERLMAAVDQDVSQEVPSAMQPLADLMDGSGQ